MINQASHCGIHMTRYIKEHEDTVRSALAAGLADYSCSSDLLAEHLEKIRWLQHERLVHLLVTVLFAAIFLVFYSYLLFLPFNVLFLVLLLITGIILAAYIGHYFRLENSTQRWYRLADDIRAVVREQACRSNDREP